MRKEWGEFSIARRFLPLDISIRERDKSLPICSANTHRNRILALMLRKGSATAQPD